MRWLRGWPSSRWERLGWRSFIAICRVEVGVQSLTNRVERCFRNAGLSAVLLIGTAALCAAGPVEFGKAQLDTAMAARFPKYKPKVIAELNTDPPETFRIEPYTAGGAHVTGGDLRGLMYGLLAAADQI